MQVQCEKKEGIKTLERSNPPKENQIRTKETPCEKNKRRAPPRITKRISANERSPGPTGRALLEKGMMMCLYAKAYPYAYVRMRKRIYVCVCMFVRRISGREERDSRPLTRSPCASPPPPASAHTQ